MQRLGDQRTDIVDNFEVVTVIVFENIKQRFRSYKERIFLKKHGCETWKEYNRRYDPDYNVKACRITDVYYGYNHVHCFEDRGHEIYDWDIHFDGIYVIDKWCEANLEHKFRFDFHRVIKDIYFNQWEINEIGGGDYIFAAFKDSQDFALFKLRWA